MAYPTIGDSEKRVPHTPAEGPLGKPVTKILVDGSKLNDHSRTVAMQCPWVRMVLGPENFEGNLVEGTEHLILSESEKYRIDPWETFSPGVENLLRFTMPADPRDRDLAQQFEQELPKMTVNERDIVFVIIPPELLSFPLAMDVLGNALTVKPKENV